MSVSDEERDTLHHILDALLNARSYMENLDKDELQARGLWWSAWSRSRSDFFENASVFFRRVIGPNLHEDELRLFFDLPLREDDKNTEVPAAIANAFRSFLPLFMQNARTEYGGKDEKIVSIISDLMGIYWGDDPRFFSILPKRQGLHKRPYRLARLRLSALDWDKYLACVGVPPHERHARISTAYRTDWEAIRKWAKSVDEQFDLQSYPPRYPEHAKAEFEQDPKAIYEEIQRDGNAYWVEKCSAQSGRD